MLARTATPNSHLRQILMTATSRMTLTTKLEAISQLFLRQQHEGEGEEDEAEGEEEEVESAKEEEDEAQGQPAMLQRMAPKPSIFGSRI